ncbi:LEAF RUST 10 DISEASE-RESISTANCE LOCUS RECEPTOR-LIKE PROTEIN KINASE-like 2.1 [Humulus lupulus]|uniref:LEAF RUST 10 DISEASE-RESISTANCE LOCUS RECEPTOR-LIKE PROTEIN KINASE-like 2.1 n=1 Tax=Humulus lupulus TaxID=3486 RepID=UPI002B417097|nr:LEAF RUST 10 DISEASE-RESISTANCE LOCUS RECEPTOR-LIKE PROTEIN KINASE-like 2.1 [Humulus lupulus]
MKKKNKKTFPLMIIMLCRRLLKQEALLLIFQVLTLLHASIYAANIRPVCSSSCGSFSNIKSPFRFTTDPSSCGDFRYNLSCENNITVLNLPIGYIPPTLYQRYYVLAINYDNYTIRVVDPNFHKLHQNYSSFFTNNTLSLGDFNLYDTSYAATILLDFNSREMTRDIAKTLVLISCERVVMNSSYYIDAAPCISSHYNNDNSSFIYPYFILNANDMNPSELDESCFTHQVTLIDGESFHGSQATCYDIKKQLSRGFQLSWIRSFDKTGTAGFCALNEKSNKVRCEYGQRFCEVTFEILFRQAMFYTKYYLYENGRYKYTVGFLGPRAIPGFLFFICLLVYKWRRRHLSMYDGIEDFLQSHNNLMPIRYSYRDIRKMTKGFKEKLGEGGFGTVYKGQLSSGPFVAVKMLEKSKTNGQDFINEVATIGRIHHVNVVRLIGFCVEGARQALIYDFMSNGSLEKYIFSREKMSVSLSYTKVFEISLGIARGIEYLHQGCDMQILHFDIKPHNILLDENFIPKISDFGLARSCSLDNSLVSLTVARGTIGYIAPELFYKNIGRVSNKADVYSFGMMLMEMANQRKNVNALTKNSSHVYIPLLIHKQFNKGNDIEVDEHVTEEESKTIKKMAIVALWCIQLKPCDRPTMSQAIEMLESNLECLQVPPNLHLYPQEAESNNNEDAENSFSLTLSQEYSTDDN